MWRVFGWLLALATLVCAVGGWGPAAGAPLMRVGAVAFAVFLVYLMVRVEMMLWSVARSGRTRPPDDEDG
jgi:hypothetical protein